MSEAQKIVITLEMLPNKRISYKAEFQPPVEPRFLTRKTPLAKCYAAAHDAVAQWKRDNDPPEVAK